MLMVKSRPKSNLTLISEVLERVVVTPPAEKPSKMFQSGFRFISAQKEPLLNILMVSELQTVDWFLYWFYWTSVVALKHRSASGANPQKHPV